MIDAQIACEREQRGAGARHAKKHTWTRKPRVHPLLASLETEIVCVAGEANAWPYRARDAGEVYEDELVHWVACRLSSGETFERVVAPARPLAPRTTTYVDLDVARLRSGGTRDELFASWRAFVRETDVVCFWGHYAAALFVASGGHLPARRLDLRAVSRDYTKARVGTLDEHIARTGVSVATPRMDGRAGRRLAQATALVEHFAGLAAKERR